MKRILASVLCITMLFTVLCGCNSEKSKNENDILFVTSFYPIYIFTINVVDGIDEIAVECMAEQNVGCLHDYQLLNKDARLIESADIFIINGASMEVFLEDIYENTEGLVVLDSSEGVSLIENCSEEHYTHSEEGEHHNHSHAHNHSVNSHIWMSVENAKIQVGNISKKIIELYPQFEEQVSANTEEYIKRLDLLKDELLLISVGMKNKNIITFHEAYAYMAQELSFNVIATIESHEGAEPSAKELAKLTEIIKSENVEVLFTEPDYKGSAATILSAEAGVEICTLNPVIKGEKTKTAYEDIMKENMMLLAEAVG